MIKANSHYSILVEKVNSGTLIIHDAFIRVDQIQSLSHIISVKNIGVWRLTLQPQEGPQNIQFTRLFPFGGVILLTHSLILYRPFDALRLLMWMKLVKYNRNRANFWKLGLRSHVCPWLLSILDSFDDTKKDIFGHGKQVYADIHYIIYSLLQKDVEVGGPVTTLVPGGTMTLVHDPETPNDEAPLVAPSPLRELQSCDLWTPGSQINHLDIEKADQILIEWFSEWAIIKCPSYRRFMVVLGPEPSEKLDHMIKVYSHKHCHLEFVTAEKCYTRLNVTAQTELDALAKKRIEKLCEKMADSEKIRMADKK